MDKSPPWISREESLLTSAASYEGERMKGFAPTSGAPLKKPHP